MLKSTKYFGLPVVILIFCVLSIVAYSLWRSMEETAYESCIASIASQIQRSDLSKNLVSENKDWKILSEEEIDFLMSKVSGYDCGRFDNQTVDIWNRKINIALQQPKDRIEIRIWSKGQDGVSGTDDDLIIPYGVKPPK